MKPLWNSSLPRIPPKRTFHPPPNDATYGRVLVPGAAAPTSPPCQGPQNRAITKGSPICSIPTLQVSAITHLHIPCWFATG
ncbi:hypothetical protein BD779DRAFT_1566971, partial [Infundibulicybe gibba]